MSGALWVTSYMILVASVCGLFLAVAALYRTMAQPGRVRDVYTWPLRGIASGSRIPPFLRDKLEALTDGTEAGLLLVVTSIEIDSYACANAAQRAAEILDWRVAVVVRSDRGLDSPPKPLTLGDLPLIEVDRSEFAALGVSRAPVLVYARNGTIVDASPGLVSPSEIVRFFAPFEAATQLGGSFSIVEGGASWELR